MVLSRLKKKLRKTPSLCFLPYMVNLAVDVCLVAVGISKMNIALFGALELMPLVVVYAGLKTGVIQERFRTWSVHKNPKAFWYTALGWLVFYLFLSISLPYGLIHRHAVGIDP